MRYVRIHLVEIRGTRLISTSNVLRFFETVRGESGSGTWRSRMASRSRVVLFLFFGDGEQYVYGLCGQARAP